MGCISVGIRQLCSFWYVYPRNFTRYYAGFDATYTENITQFACAHKTVESNGLIETARDMTVT